MTRLNNIPTTAGADVLAKKAEERRAKNRAAAEAYRKRVKADPQLWEEKKKKDKERAQRNRQKPVTEEENQHRRFLHNQRQARYLAKKKAEADAQDNPPARETRQDTAKADARREYLRLAVQKHRDNQHPNKKRRVLEKRKEYYYRKKSEKEELLRKNREKATQAEETLKASGCPYPTRDAYLRAVRRLKARVKVKGSKFAFLFKGILKSADKDTKKSLKQLNITCTSPQKGTAHATQASLSAVLRDHIKKLKEKRGKATLQHKRVLAEVFRNAPDTGFSSRFLKSSSEKKTLYSSGSKVQRDIADFF